jgi:hypothetical protein
LVLVGDWYRLDCLLFVVGGDGVGLVMLVLVVWWVVVAEIFTTPFSLFGNYKALSTGEARRCA